MIDTKLLRDLICELSVELATLSRNEQGQWVSYLLKNLEAECGDSILEEIQGMITDGFAHWYTSLEQARRAAGVIAAAFEQEAADTGNEGAAQDAARWRARAIEYIEYEEKDEQDDSPIQ
jgi:hypothetical protein